jgi:hypothetical protein
MQDPTPRRRRKPPAFLAAIAAVLVAIGGITIAATSDDDGHGHKKHAVTIALGQGRQKPPTLIKLSPGEQQTVANQAAEAARGETGAAEAHLNAPAPHRDDAVANADLTPLVQQGPPPPTTTGAAPSQSGCTTALVRNYSSRNGAPVLLGMFHWTGSQFGSGQAIVSWFDQSRSQASSNYIVDRRGRCWLTVAESLKAWTQAYYNPWAVSNEIVNPGVLPLFADKAQFDATVRLAVAWHHHWGIPYRRGAVANGRVTRSGFLAHKDLGSLGGGHPDLGAYDYMIIVRAAQALDGKAKITGRDRAACRRAHAYRGRRHHTAKGTRRQEARLARLHARKLRCVDGHVRRR